MATTKKDLKFFMRPETPEIVTVPGPESFVDDEGNRIQFEIKTLSQAEIQNINNKYRKRSIVTDKKGNPLAMGGEVIWKTEKDSDKAARHLIVEALQYPNLKDEELMKYYNCVDVTDMPLHVFSKGNEFAYVQHMVLLALGLIEEPASEDIKDDAKN